MFLHSDNKSETNGVDLSICVHVANGDSVVDVDNVDVLSRFYLPLCSREVKVREAALAEIEHRLDQWLHEDCSSPTQNGSSVANGAGDYWQLVTLHVPTLLRLSESCPFPDVRAKCAQILQTVSEKGFLVPFKTTGQGASSFIPTFED
uniref:Mon2 C-terminal domain-containing protein n=1 Tax=Graphocephala atropunctata TaxID=36148 RepID=A0A1B6LLF3_9HEMI